jgi:hypothetical protein
MSGHPWPSAGWNRVGNGWYIKCVGKWYAKVYAEVMQHGKVWNWSVRPIAELKNEIGHRLMVEAMAEADGVLREKRDEE